MRDRVLVVKLGALGDVIMATALLRRIQAHHPDDELWLLTSKPFNALFRAWRSADGFAQQNAGLFLAASMAILTSALLSFPYRSKPFSIYLFIFLAALAFLDQSRRTVP